MEYFEVATRDENGVLVRGGIKGTKEEAESWAEQNRKSFPDEEFVVVEANEDAITYDELYTLLDSTVKT